MHTLAQFHDLRHELEEHGQLDITREKLQLIKERCVAAGAAGINISFTEAEKMLTVAQEIYNNEMQFLNASLATG